MLHVRTMRLAEGAGLALAVLASLGATQAAPAGDANWAGTGGPAGETHFSPLSTINSGNVAKLGLAWSLDLPGEHSLEAVPLAVDGVLYFTGQTSAVYAVDAVSGKLLWHYDPETYLRRPLHQRYVMPVNRGVAYWKGKVFVGTLDGRLIALEARTGKPAWSVQTLAEDSRQTITGAPRVFNDKVVIGNGGGDFGARGYVTAYDTETGHEVWRFYTVPGNPADGFEQPAMKMAADTWRGQWWKTGTGGTVWDSMTYDPELNRLYIGTGNSGPYNPRVRTEGVGDNLFLASIVALDADTGRYVWHYQVNPQEAWDYKATANISLADMEIGGQQHKVLMQAPTNGFFYVVDRENGKLLGAEKYGKVTWAKGVDLKTGRPIEEPGIRYEKGPVTFWPGPYGAHNWQPMAFSPRTGLAYIPYMQLAARYSEDAEYMARLKKGGARETAFGGGAQFETLVVDGDDGKGALVAWDPVAQKIRWKVAYPSMWNGGVLATAGGLVFQGDADGIFHGYDASTGAEAWHFDAKLGIIAAPITYTVRGVQFVSILVGYGGAAGLNSKFVNRGWKYGQQPRRLLTFKLGGKARLPATAPRDLKVAALDDPALKLNEAEVAEGAALYGSNCAMCHGMALQSSGAPAPDLRESAIALKRENLAVFLPSGAASPSGMPRFEEFSPEQIRGLHMYIRAGAREALGLRKPTEKLQGAGRF